MGTLTALAIRTLHVLTVTVLIGASGALWYGYRSGTLTALAPARQYEWLFWGGLGTIVLTGVGNLGASGVPGPATDWGRTLLAKLAMVLVLVLGSAVRALLVVRLERHADLTHHTDHSGSPVGAARTLAHAHGGTTGVLLVTVVLAEVLAHG